MPKWACRVRVPVSVEVERQRGNMVMQSYQCMYLHGVNKTSDCSKKERLYSRDNNPSFCYLNPLLNFVIVTRGCYQLMRGLFEVEYHPAEEVVLRFRVPMLSIMPEATRGYFRTARKEVLLASPQLT